MKFNKGLSVLELLIGLAVLALIAGGLSGAMGFGAKVWDRSRGLGASEEALVLRQRLRTWLTQANPPSNLTVFRAGFVGDTQSLRFVTFSQTPFAPEAAALRVHILRQGQSLMLNFEQLGDKGEVLATVSRQLVEKNNQFADHLFRCERPRCRLAGGME